MTKLLRHCFATWLPTQNSVCSPWKAKDLRVRLQPEIERRRRLLTTLLWCIATPLGRLVTLVGAAYDSAAFAVPFGPAFAKILRTPQSWRRSVVFEQIASFPGRLTVVRATEDTVVPATTGELLIANARRAEHTEIVDILSTDHVLGMALRAQPGLVDRLGNVICHAILA